MERKRVGGDGRGSTGRRVVRIVVVMMMVLRMWRGW